MIKWILIIWFATHGNYSYVPVVAGEYTSQESCQYAANSWIKLADFGADGNWDEKGYRNVPLKPRAMCLPKK
ncbi:MAG: hypothetical protein WC476_12810 [Phycisphaerae bacterium]|jgi:hypothetical protein